MITWEEIRDIIQDETYVGSGCVLGITDAAKAIIAHIEATQPSVQRTTDKNGKTFNPYDLNDVARVDEFIKRR